MGEVALKVENISKTFPGVRALNKVTFEVHKGEIHSLVGENGAGKSTLMNIIMGVFPPNEGQMFLDDNEISPKNPHEAQLSGIGIVPQELNLVPYITVAENILLGTAANKGLFSRVNWKDLFSKAKELIDLLNINVNEKEITFRLSPAQQQLVQIARCLALNCRILIMDEPTATLTSEEVKTLFRILVDLRKQGKTIIYICHKLDEVFEISDRITIMRDGQFIATKKVSETNEKEIIKFMVGRELDLGERTPREHEFGEVILEARNISNTRIKNVSFNVKKGEIIGFAGLVGAGRTELVSAVFGADKITGGQIFFEGKVIEIKNPKDAINLGIGFIPEERRSQGILPMESVKANITLPILSSISSKLGFISGKEKKIAQKYSDLLGVKTPNINQKIAFLSGGNQQKGIIARWLARDCKVLVFDEPTRGIDVGAKRDIYNLIKDLAKKGIAIIIVSSEFPELFSLTDRIYVMNDGLILKEFLTEEATQEKIMESILESK